MALGLVDMAVEDARARALDEAAHACDEQQRIIGGGDWEEAFQRGCEACANAIRKLK